jgi:hypothetical protein
VQRFPLDQMERRFMRCGLIRDLADTARKAAIIAASKRDDHNAHDRCSIRSAAVCRMRWSPREPQRAVPQGTRLARGSQNVRAISASHLRRFVRLAPATFADAFRAVALRGVFVVRLDGSLSAISVSSSGLSGLDMAASWI